jgi:NADH-quinone oxidoreductase E subunit
VKKVDKSTSEVTTQHGGKGDLIAILNKIQERYGYISEEQMSEIAKGLDISMGEVVEVATFYSFLSIKPLGKNIIRVCKSTPCYIKDYKKMVEILEKELGIKAGETTPDRKFTLQLVNCIGACDMAPAMMINHTLYGDLNPERIKVILKDYK